MGSVGAIEGSLETSEEEEMEGVLPPPMLLLLPTPMALPMLLLTEAATVVGSRFEPCLFVVMVSSGGKGEGGEGI